MRARGGSTAIDDRSDTASWSTVGSDEFDRPSSARVYDFLLGGAAHGAADRDLGRSLIAAEPLVVPIARENRSFLRRAVTYLAAAGVDQFLDLGSGIPTMGATHEVARRVDPHARVAYVDWDPVAVAHGALLLDTTEGVSVTCADLRSPESVLAAAGVTRVLDLRRPVAVLLVSVLQHIPCDRDTADVVTGYLDRLAAGSALALSHLSGDDPRVDVASLERLSGTYVRGGLHARSREVIATFLGGVDLVDPGLVYAAEWRPELRRARGLPSPPCCGHRAGVGWVRSPG